MGLISIQSIARALAATINILGRDCGGIMTLGGMDLASLREDGLVLGLLGFVSHSTKHCTPLGYDCQALLGPSPDPPEIPFGFPSDSP